MDEMSSLLELASTGDENALKKLNLDQPVKVGLDKPYANVGIIRLTGEFEAAMAMIAAADRLQLWTLAASCRNKVKYLQFIAKEFCKTTLANKPIPGDTVADVMKDLLDEIEIRKQQVEGEKKTAESDSETDMVQRKGNKKKGEESKREECQCASSVKDTDKEMEIEYGKEQKTQQKKSNEMEGKSQTLSSDLDIVEKLVEDKEEEEARGKDKENKQEQEGQSKTSESSLPSEAKDKGAGTIKGKEEKNPAKKVTVNNSKVRKCPLCQVNVTHLRRHVVALHINKGERLAVSQLESILQAAIHGEEKQGKERLEKRLGKKISFKGRVREKCPLCDKAVLALTTHLQRTHNLKKDDSIYKSAMRIVRPYEGKTKEVKSCKRKAEDQPKASHVKKRPALTPLGVLVQAVDVESDEKDSDYIISSDDESHNSSESSNSVLIIPPTPDKQGSPMLKASVVKRKITEEENFNETDGVEDNEDIEDKQDENKGSDDEKEDEYESIQDDEDEGSENDIGDEEWQQWAVKEFYKGRPKGFRHQLLKYFYEHLQDLGGGANKERQAGIHAQNVRKLLDHLDPKNDTISCLIEDGGLQMWRNWGKPILEESKMRPGTVKSYLSSVGKFLKFIIQKVADETKEFPSIDERSLRLANNVLNRLPDWRTAISRKFSHKKWERVLEVSRRLPPASTINDLMSIEPGKEAITILNKSSTGHFVSSREFIIVRDFLIVRLELENAQRPGPMETATVTNFREAERSDDGSYTMYCPKHKRSIDGPARICMDAETHANMCTYVEHVRGVCADDSEDALFLTVEGKPFDQSNIGKRVTAFWFKAKQIKLSSTDVRKIASSATYDMDVVEKRAIHEHMAHKEQTADHYYNIGHITKKSARGHQLLKKSLGLDTSVATQSNTKSADSTKLDDIPPEEESDPIAHDEGLSSSQVEVIEMLFSSQIVSQAQITFDIVRNTMAEHTDLSKFASDPKMVKKVYDKVCYLRRKEKQKMVLPSKEPEPSLSRTETWVNNITEVESASSVTHYQPKAKWNKPDENYVENFFGKYSVRPSKEELKSLFHSNNGLKEILNRNDGDFERCYNKVKYIFKKKGAKK